MTEGRASDKRLDERWLGLTRAVKRLNEAVMSREGRLRVMVRVKYPKGQKPAGLYLDRFSCDSDD